MRRWRLILLTFVIAVVGWAREPYRLGEGWQPTEHPLYIGGYLSLLTDLRERQQTVGVDELALMVYGEFERWGVKTFPAGHMVSCYDCHDGPDGEDD